MSHKILLATAAILLGAFAAPAFAADADPVVAKVNGSEIHRSEVLDQIKHAGPQAQHMPVDMVFPQILQRMVMTKLVSDKGYDDKLQDSAEVKAQMKDAERQIVAQAYVEKTIRPKITDAKVKERYDQLAAKYTPHDEVRASHILVKTEAAAKDLIKKIKDGADFAKLAEEASEDKGSAKQGGDLGYFAKEAMVKAFAEAAFGMGKGDVSKSPVKTEFGYHLIKVVDKRKSAAPALDEVRGQIENQLGQEMTAELIKDLEAKAKIERFNADGSPMEAKK